MIIESNEYIEDIKKISDQRDILDTNSPFSKYIVYLLNNNVIGFCFYQDIYDRLEITYIYVKEEYRKNNIGTKLLEYLINNNKDKHNITLEVRKNNIPALKLYEKLSFKKVALREKYYGSIDGILMERKF